MKGLTPLERMFVEEFCRFAGAPEEDINRLEIAERRSCSDGFVAKVMSSSVPPSFHWPLHFFDPPRVALVGTRKTVMMMLLVFDEDDGKLASIEGDALTLDWNEEHEPAFWSETHGVIDQRRHN